MGKAYKILYLWDFDPTVFRNDIYMYIASIFFFPSFHSSRDKIIF